MFSADTAPDPETALGQLRRARPTSPGDLEVEGDLPSLLRFPDRFRGVSLAVPAAGSSARLVLSAEMLGRPSPLRRVNNF